MAYNLINILKEVENAISADQADMARLLGLSQSTYSKLVNGEVKKISSECFSKLISEKNINPEFLLTGKGPVLKEHIPKKENPIIVNDNTELIRMKAQIELLKEERDKLIDKLIGNSQPPTQQADEQHEYDNSLDEENQGTVQKKNLAQGIRRKFA